MCALVFELGKALCYGGVAVTEPCEKCLPLRDQQVFYKMLDPGVGAGRG
jgi:hypothetical protein